VSGLDRQSKTVLAIAAATLVAGGVALARIGGDGVDLFCASLLVFVLPGLAVACANPVRVRVGERHAVAVAFGIAATILGTVAVAALGLRLDSTLWVLLLMCVSLGACVATFVLFPQRRPVGRGPGRLVPGEDRLPRAIRDLSLGVLAICLLAAAAVVTFTSKSDQIGREPFTQLWVMPTVGESDTATVGLRNRESQSRSFTVKALGRGGEIKSWRDLDLAPGETWSGRVHAPLGGGRVRVVATAGDQVERTVDLTLE
jgi:hypothetical protein